MTDQIIQPRRIFLGAVPLRATLAQFGAIMSAGSQPRWLSRCIRKFPPRRDLDQNGRWRIGTAQGEAKYDRLEKKLAALPAIGCRRSRWRPMPTARPIAGGLCKAILRHV